MDKTAYYNDLMARMEELFYHELSDCAGWKTEMIGTDFIQSKNIRGDTREEIIDNCIREIMAEGLVGDMDYAIGGKEILLKLTMKKCIHLKKEKVLKERGVPLYNCPVTNMILDQLIEKLNFETTYIADIAVDDMKGVCKVKAAIYETPDMIGVVSDWTKEKH